MKQEKSCPEQTQVDWSTLSHFAFMIPQCSFSTFNWTISSQISLYYITLSVVITKAIMLFYQIVFLQKQLCSIVRSPLPKLTRQGAVRFRTSSSGQNIEFAFLIFNQDSGQKKNSPTNRFGDARNLTFAIPEKSWMYSFQQSFHHSMIRWAIRGNCTKFRYWSLICIWWLVTHSF